MSDAGRIRRDRELRQRRPDLFDLEPRPSRARLVVLALAGFALAFLLLWT